MERMSDVNFNNTNGFSTAAHGPGRQGRVALLPGENGAPFHLFAGDVGIREAAGETVSRSLDLNPTGALFMSGRNIDALQEGIRYGVYVRSGGKHVIGRQSDMELATVMRALFLQHGRNTTLRDGGCDVAEVRRLNGLVIDYCVDRILSEISLYVRYRADISELPVPLARGRFESNKGSRSLHQPTF